MKYRLNPCGMIMDMMRVGYTTKIQPFYDSDKTYTMSWYPAPKGAKCLDFHHIYASGIWQWNHNLPYEGPGEVWLDPHKFKSGRNPPPYKGQCYIGKQEWFEQGCSVKILDEPPPEIPECCRSDVVQRPAIILGGRVKTLPLTR